MKETQTKHPGRTIWGLTPSTLLLLALLAIAPYLLLPAKPFIADSFRAIADNPAVQQGPLLKVFAVDFWGTSLNHPASTGSYRPLVSLSYALQARIFGNIPQVFHLVDMLLHALGTVLVGALIATWKPGSRWVVPCAALFAMHPALSEAVVSLVGRADLMASVALLAALVLHLRSALCVDEPQRARWIIGLVAAAMLCKEYAVAFPFVIVGFDLAVSASGRVTTAHRHARTRTWLGLFAVLAGYLALRLILTGSLGGVPMLAVGDQPLFDQPLSVRVGTGLSTYLTAARLVVWPWPLNYFYSVGALPLSQGLFDPRTVLGILLIAALAVWSVWNARNRRDPWPAIGSLLFVLTLAPALNLVSIAGVLFGERFLYAPVAGVVLVLASRLETWPARLHDYARYAVFALVAVFGVSTMLRVDDWRSTESLARSALIHYPTSAQALVELGLAVGASGLEIEQQAREAALKGDAAREQTLLEDSHKRTLEAKDVFERALVVEPRRAFVWKNYGVALEQWAEFPGITPDERAKRFKQAADAWRKALELSPQDLAPLWFGLGRTELGSRRFEAAVRSLTRAAELAPQDDRIGLVLANALMKLAQVRMQEGNVADAAQQAKRAIEVAKLPSEGYFLGGLILASANQRAEADNAFALALQSDPELLNKLQSQAVGLSQNNQHAAAAEVFRQMLLARPASVSTMLNLGRELFLAGRPAEAVKYLKAGVDRSPDNLPARQLLSEAMRVTMAARP